RCAIGGDSERLDEGVPVGGGGHGLVELGERLGLLARLSTASPHVLAGSATHVADVIQAAVRALVRMQALARQTCGPLRPGRRLVLLLTCRRARTQVRDQPLRSATHGRSPMSRYTGLGLFALPLFVPPLRSYRPANTNTFCAIRAANAAPMRDGFTSRVKCWRTVAAWTSP